jgi:hypothetical protein
MKIAYLSETESTRFWQILICKKYLKKRLCHNLFTNRQHVSPLTTLRLLFTVALFRAGASIVNETFQNGSQILTSVSSSLQNAIPQAISNYTKCLSSNTGLFPFFMGIATCGASQVAAQFAGFANTVNAQIQSSQKIFSQLLSPSSINSTVHTIPQMADLAAQMFSSLASQLMGIDAQTMQCIAQAMNPTY